MNFRLPRDRFGDDQSALNFVLGCGDLEGARVGPHGAGTQGSGPYGASGMAAAGRFTRQQAMQWAPRLHRIDCAPTQLRMVFGVLSPTLYRTGHGDTKSLSNPKAALLLHPNYTPAQHCSKRPSWHRRQTARLEGPTQQALTAALSRHAFPPRFPTQARRRGAQEEAAAQHHLWPAVVRGRRGAKDRVSWRYCFVCIGRGARTGTDTGSM